MTLMGDGLKKVAGNKLELVLYRLSNTTLKGLLLGTGVTAVIQSSSATSVMVVGFVNSGMMKVRQAISVILGAILGTSITGWVICLSYIEGTSGISSLLSTSTLTGVIAVVGIILRMFSKKKSRKHVGDILMGFAVLMFGMSTMSGAVSTLGDQEWFTSALTSMANPLLGILVGALFTAILQSASAAVGIIQALSVTGAMTLDVALPLLMGVAIGASVPVLLSALGANTNGKRTALVYLVSCVVGVMFCAAVFYILNAIIKFSFMTAVMNPFSLAFVNTVLRFAMVLFLMPFSDVLETVVELLIPEKRLTEEEDPTVRLEERFINHPALAIEQSRMTINDMAERAKDAINTALWLMMDYSEAGFETVEKIEDEVDNYEDKLGSYLIKLTGRELTERQNEDVSIFLHTLSDYERISDHAMNVAESAKEIDEKKIKFSENALHELDVIRAAVSEIVRLTVETFVKHDINLAKRVEPLEEHIDELCDRMKLNHIERLQHGLCTINQGFVFNDFLTDCERVSDHCSNIAIAMIELESDAYDTHEYLINLQEERSQEYDDYFHEYAERFAI
ncbi:MAG: Na/Pi cotransporter family protein [Oscillospiraceae bacterium]|nr:Na/Pi cotransporter family protein [Oscillospiraceae bacterium]